METYQKLSEFLSLLRAEPGGTWASCLVGSEKERWVSGRVRVVTEEPRRGRRFPSTSLAHLPASGSLRLVSSGARISWDDGTTSPLYRTGSRGPRKLSHLPGFTQLALRSTPAFSRCASQGLGPAADGPLGRARTGDSRSREEEVITWDCF